MERHLEGIGFSPKPRPVDQCGNLHISSEVFHLRSHPCQLVQNLYSDIQFSHRHLAPSPSRWKKRQSSRPKCYWTRCKRTKSSLESKCKHLYCSPFSDTVNKLTHSHSYFSENYRAQLINDFPQSNYLLTVPVVVSLAVTSSHSSSPWPPLRGTFSPISCRSIWTNHKSLSYKTSQPTGTEYSCSLIMQYKCVCVRITINYKLAANF